jgi:type II secretory pathway pseudopilin PulG
MKRGFTLIEVLISLVLCMTLTVLATTAFFQVEKLVRRTESRLEMHNSLRFLQRTASEDISALINGSAVFLTSTTSTAASGDPANAVVSLVFMRGRMDPQDFPMGEEYGLYMRECSDLTWVEWRWDQRRKALLRGVNQRTRQFRATKSWVGTDANGTSRDFYNSDPNQTRRFYQLPQPWRVASGGLDTVLNRNWWGTGSPQDIGDRDDLTGQLSPVLQNVTACSIHLLLADGSEVAADGSVNSASDLDGTFVDGAVPTIAPPTAKRPLLIRMRIEMTDPTNGLVQSFSCSFQPPGLLPPLAL